MKIFVRYILPFYNKLYPIILNGVYVHAIYVVFEV